MKYIHKHTLYDCIKKNMNMMYMRLCKHEFDPNGLCENCGSQAIWYELKGDSKQELEVDRDFPAGEYHIGYDDALDKIVNTYTNGKFRIERNGLVLSEEVLGSAGNGKLWICQKLEKGDKIIIDAEFRGIIFRMVFDE